MSQLPGCQRRTADYDFFVIGAFRYPHGDASSQRLLTLAQAAAAAGRRPIVINDGDSSAPSGYQAHTIDSTGGVDYLCLPGAKGMWVRRLAHRASRSLRLAWTLRRLQSPSSTNWALVASGLCTPGVLLLLRCFLRYSVIADVVERHDASQFPQGRRASYFIRHRFTSWLCRFATDYVIVISCRLAQYYSSSKPPALVIPALVDLSEFPSEPTTTTRPGTTLLYVGNPAGKDRLGIVFDALEQIPSSDRVGLRFVIAGCDRSQLADSPDVGTARLNRLGAVVEPRGFVPRREALQLLQEADFTVLLRPSGGYADAGFPTKVPESLAAGCPVLCNITSDLGFYLRDGYNAVVCSAERGSKDVSVEAVRQAILRTLHMTTEERLAMRMNSAYSVVGFSSVAWGNRLARIVEANA